MALLTEATLRSLGRSYADGQRFRTADAILKEHASAASLEVHTGKRFDVFLSHSVNDAAVVLGLKVTLESKGLTVYVDWVEDHPRLDRTKVTAATAGALRARMQSSRSLIYAHSNNSPQSKWMPWELGYFDGLRGAVAVLPIAKDADETFQGQEFLGLYPYIDVVGASLFVNRGTAPRSRIGTQDKNFVGFKEWLRMHP